MSDPAPHVPGVEGAGLAVVLRTTQWTLDDLAHDLPAGRVTPAQVRDLATVLERLSSLLRSRYG